MAITTIDYTYDNLSRLLEADYVGGSTYTYGYDLAGNLVNKNGTTHTFNSANQLTGNGTDSFEYDANGNLWKTNSVVSHTWDRANRLLSHGGLDYAYDGLSNRISQDNGTDVTSYLLDLQAGLPRVLSETVGANVTRFIHSPRGLHATQNPADAWFYSLQDGLGSQRAEIGANVAVVGSQEFTPYGVVQNVTGTFSSPHAFTGEPLDANGLQYHRARYYDPAMGVWASLDPFEGLMDMPMSLNGYGYVEGNVANWIDSNGLCVPKQICLMNVVDPCECFEACDPPATEEEKLRYDCNTEATACKKFIAELCDFTNAFLNEINNPQPVISLGPVSISMEPTRFYSRDVLLNMYGAQLGQYYAGVPFSVGSGTIPLFWRFWGGGGQFERYGMPNKEDYPGPDAWRNPIYYPDRLEPEFQQLRQTYGFRRPYYGNTHHYFAYLKYALDSSTVAWNANYNGEINDLTDAYKEWKENPDNPEYNQRYGWLYQEAVNDLYIVDHAIKAAQVIHAKV